MLRAKNDAALAISLVALIISLGVFLRTPTAEEVADEILKRSTLQLQPKPIELGEIPKQPDIPYLTVESAEHKALAREGSVEVVTKYGEKQVLKIPFTGQVSSLIFGPDGKSIAIVTKGTAEMQMWSLETKQRL
ncbi:hypothetical protein HYZ99_04915 [Candidatus Peregrinibacteria bacterium]|nr:hypothetical protein [Candidatus Peregrinibacteria bacterium]